MDDTLFSQVNTTIAVKDSTMISPNQFKKMLQAQDKLALSMLLQATPYPLTEKELDNLAVIDETLMSQLIREYQWVYEQSPDNAIVDFFTIRYLYHNLKVLFKEKASQKDLSALLIPIGRQSLDVTRHLVSALDSEFFSDEMVAEIRDIWAEYLDYKDIRVLEIGIDLAYFKHLRRIAERINYPTFQQLVRVITNFYNVITVKRALKQDKPQAFMLQLLSDEGTLAPKDYIDLVKEGQLLTWFHHLNPDDYNTSLAAYEDKMRQGTITMIELEYLCDLMQFELLDEARYTTEGPLVLARYLLGRELEVKNLRLLLSAVSNGLSLEAVKERMRPIYGQ